MIANMDSLTHNLSAPVIFISDLHLESTQTSITSIFLNFMQTLTHAQALYILGDLFEAWVGDDDQSPFHEEILAAIKNVVSRGIPVFILHGNRDFLLGKRFFKITGARLLPEETVIDLFGVPTLIMHGDTLCTEDRAYQRYRKKVRNRFIQWLFLRISLKKRKQLAEKLHAKSRRYQTHVADHILDVTQEKVNQVMTQHRVTQLIHGHTHRPAIHEFTIDHTPCKRIVLAAWHTQGNALTVQDQKTFILKNF